jgi:hypothetical protein
MNTIEFSQSVCGDMEAVAAAAGPDASPREVAAQLAPLLPIEMHAALTGFRQGRGEGALLIHGVGPGTIPDEAASYRELPVAAPLLLGLVSLIGTPVAARDEWDGAPLTDIKVTPGLENTVSSKGKGGLPLHQESQHLPHPPDGLALLTLRGGCPTRLASTRVIVEAVRAKFGTAVLDVLREPIYTHKLPDSFDGPAASEPTPILLGTDDMPELKVDLTTTRAQTDRGEWALESLTSVVAEVADDVPLAPGDLIAFDNRRWLHGRGSNAASPDRWLLRSLFVYDSWRAQGEVNETGEAPLAVFA